MTNRSTKPQTQRSEEHKEEAMKQHNPKDQWVEMMKMKSNGTNLEIYERERERAFCVEDKMVVL